MSPQLQTKLLRALQEREFEPVGSSRTERVDVRIVAATNQNLPQLIRERKFREDLYFRLAVVPIEVPPLRHRREDIPLLVRHFLEVQRRSYPEIQGVTEPALKRMVEYDWPGNVRELQALIERLTILRRTGWIDESGAARRTSSVTRSSGRPCRCPRPASTSRRWCRRTSRS